VHGAEKLNFDPSFSGPYGAVDQKGDANKPSALSGDNKRQFNEYQMRQMKLMRANVESMEQGMVGLLGETLPVLDRFSEFSRRLEACQLQQGGIGALGNKDLEGLQREASSLLEEAQNLDGIAMMLGSKYLSPHRGELSEFEDSHRNDIMDGLRPPVAALLQAVDTINSKVKAVKSLVNDIQLQRLSADATDFFASMKDLVAGPVSEPPVQEAEEVRGRSTNPFAPENFPEGLTSASTGSTQSTNPFDRPASQVVSEPQVRESEEPRGPSTNPFDDENATQNSSSTRPLNPGQSNVSPPQRGATESTNPFDQPPSQSNYNPFR